MRPRPQFGDRSLGSQPRQHPHPELHVGALQRAHVPPVGVGQQPQVTILHADHRGIRQREPHVEVDQPPQRPCGIGLTLDDGPPPAEQPLRRVHQDRGEHGLLARKVPVYGGAADPGRPADVFEGDAVVAVLGEQPGGGFEQRGPALLLGERTGRVRERTGGGDERARGGHGPSLDTSVNHG